MDPSFAIVRKANQVVILRPEFQDAALGIFGLQGQAPAPEPGAVVSGRGGRYARYPVDAKGTRGILKHYRHGGWMARLLGDLFFGLRRPIREFLVAERARQSGIPTGTLLAARVQAVAKLFYRGDVLLKEIPSARDLGDLLKNPPPAGRERNRVLRAVAATVRKMHDEGLVHGDLNVKNLLVQTGNETEGRFVAYVIDLDQAGFRQGPLPPSDRAGNLLRLGRSFLKVGGDRLQVSLTRRFLAAYCGRDGWMRRQMRNQLQTYPLAYHMHKLGWRVRGR